ncbi:C-3 sterol dehydrogenase/C-4 decarboxylase-like protein [Dendryphion nanum]|uniref:C-3 sterol dehydrogenase/C-4 decarboxylase-like protein n=1 Tax=Dendryphion nanum TaxID=256645 RepID=A0A9P9IR16_9PLEO|nr:C-3 sterol dehydrogenase/C-4 decarboxylase-like protein [Dendryphion nanum]
MSLPPTSILVTGGTGFLGSAIVSALLSSNKYSVTVIDIAPPSLGTASFSSVRYVRADVLSPSNLHKVFQEAKPAIVVHTVGLVPLGEKRYGSKGKEVVWAVNVEGTRNVIEASKACGARGLVFTSSVTVLIDELGVDFRNVNEKFPTGRAQLVYGQTKTAAENLVLAANSNDFKTCSLRCAPIFGPNDQATIPTLHGCIARGETPFIIGDGDNLVDFLYIDNAADAHVLAVRNLLFSGAAAGEAFFITNNEPVTARDFCLAVWREFGHIPRFEVKIPARVAWYLGWASEWVNWATGTQGTFSRGLVTEAVSTRYMSIAKAMRILGYDPKVKLPEGLKISCKHYSEKLQARKKR